MATLLDIRVIVPDLRNGEVTHIQPAAPRASIPSAYKWAHIANLAPPDYVRYVDAVIRAQYAQVLTGAGDSPSDATKADARRAGIMLGAARAGAAAAFSLRAEDFNPEEVAGTGSKYEPARDAVRDDAGKETQAARPASIGTAAGTAGANHTVATAMEQLTAGEVSVVNTIIYLGMAVPAMQGVSLTLSGHHFLPTTRNVFLGMKRQASQAGGTEVAAWIEGQGDKFDDLVFHKSCHPINPALKRSWAKSPAMAERLIASGHGAAAIRIPALPSDAQSGKACVAVFTKAAPVIKGMGHHIEVEEGHTLIHRAERATEGRDEKEAVDAIRAWYAAHSNEAAFCAGIVQHLTEASGATRESTLRAFSVKKVMADHAADVTRGVTYCRAFLARLREEASEGRFSDPNIHA